MAFNKNLNKYKKLALKPKEFFRSIASEDVAPAIKFYLYAVIIFSVVIIILSFFTSSFSPASIIKGIIGIISNVLISFLLVLIFSALVYAGTLIYNKGKAEFSSIFRILLYSLTITLFYSAISAILASGFEAYHPINPLISQINKGDPSIVLQEIFSDKIHMFRILLISLISIISIIHLLALATIGISESHKLKRWRSFLGIITIPIIIMLFIISAFVLAISNI